MPHARKFVAVAVFAGLGLLAVSARCIENDSLRRDRHGDWTIVGEIHNETDVQGLDMALAGNIRFPDGTVLQVEADMCPAGALSPGTFSVYSIDFFDTRAMPRPVDYSVQVTRGQASERPLRTLLGAFTATNASRDDPTSPIVRTAVDFSLENREQAQIRDNAGAWYAYCVVYYSPDGDVVRVSDVAPDFVPPESTVLTVRHVLGTAPLDAVDIRVMMFITTAEGQSLTAPRITDQIPIIDPTQ